MCRSPSCVLFGGTELTVIYIKEAASKGYLKIGVSDGEEKRYFVISTKEYEEIGTPNLREDLTRDTISQLEHCDTLYRAKLKAMRILSYGDNSTRTLIRKLKLAGFTNEVATVICEEMVSLGYINTSRQLERLITGAVNISNLGKRKIIPKLIAKGYDKKDIEAAIEKLLSVGEIDFSLARERLISRLGENASEDMIKKVLYKNGHNVCLEDL